MKTYAVTTTKELTEEDLEHIMSSALTGCTHWVDEAKLGSRKPLKDPDFLLSQAFTHDCAIKVRDMNTEEWHVVTRDHILEALSKSPRFDYENYDMYDADAVLQIAALGKETYA